jgi:hypothetical protein
MTEGMIRKSVKRSSEKIMPWLQRIAKQGIPLLDGREIQSRRGHIQRALQRQQIDRRRGL